MPVKGRHVLSVISLLAVSACATPQSAPIISVTAQGASINESTPAQRVESSSRGTSRDKVTTLEELREYRATKGSGTSSGDRLNAPALQANAMRIGLQAGLADGARKIENHMRDRATEIGRIYDFNALLRHDEKTNATFLPPVIVLMTGRAKLDDDRTLRTADAAYEIFKKAKLVERAPVWQAYLDMEACCIKPATQPGDPLPRNDAERDLWRRFVTEGWNEGIVQAQDTFQEKMNEMKRDFIGMARYIKLYNEGKVSGVVIAEVNMGNTGSGQNLRVNDRVVRITRDTRFNVDSPGQWKPGIQDVPVGQSAVPDGEIQPQPRTAEARRGGRIVPGSRPGLVPRPNTPSSVQGSSSSEDVPDTSRGY